MMVTAGLRAVRGALLGYVTGLCAAGLLGPVTDDSTPDCLPLPCRLEYVAPARTPSLRSTARPEVEARRRRPPMRTLSKHLGGGRRDLLHVYRAVVCQQVRELVAGVEQVATTREAGGFGGLLG